jgi:hypothetical protein
MTDYQKFFEKCGDMDIHDANDPFGPKTTIEDLFQAFKQRLEAEAMERCKELFENEDEETHQ